MIRWVYAFVDRPRERFAQAAEFWTTVTGTSLSERRGEAGEFVTLVPKDEDGHEAGLDACLKMQGVVGEPRGAHLDLAVEDIPALVDRAVALGASVVAEQGYVVLASPAGQLFCAVPWHGESRRPSVVNGARLDQVSIDIPPESYEEETTFWGELTGWPVLTGSRPEFRAVKPPARLPVRILLHRLATPDAPATPSAPDVRAHLDFACIDRAATRAAHERAGASFVAEYPHWTVMRDPTGALYCLTARNPHTGMLDTSRS
jgi:predicted enzyme related to lactoylglutathione lyase